MANVETQRYGPDLPAIVNFLGGIDVVDSMRYAAGEDWVRMGEDESPYIDKIVSSASSRIQVVSNNPQADLFGPVVQEMLERGVKLEILTHEQCASGFKKSLGGQYSEGQLGVYSSGFMPIHLEFIAVDGMHTFNRFPDRGGIRPGAIVRWNDQIWARDRETLFREALQTIGVISDSELAQWKEENPPILTQLQKIGQFLQQGYSQVTRILPHRVGGE